MGHDAVWRKKLVIPVVLAVVLLADAGRSVLSQELPDARVADAGQRPDAVPFNEPEDGGGGGCGCNNVD